MAETKDMADQLGDWLEMIHKNAVDINVLRRAEITKAGAEVFEKELEAVTRDKHYSCHDDKVYGHMADGISYMNSDIDGTKNGKSTVGFKNRYHGMNAMRLNDGTKSRPGDHFVTNLINDEKIQKKVLQAQFDKYQELLDKEKEDGI